MKLDSGKAGDPLIDSPEAKALVSNEFHMVTQRVKLIYSYFMLKVEIE